MRLCAGVVTRSGGVEMTQRPKTCYMLNVPTNLLAGFQVDLPSRQYVSALFMAKWAIVALRPLVHSKIPSLLVDGPCTRRAGCGI